MVPAVLADYSNDSIKENIDRNRGHEWNMEADEPNPKNGSRIRNIETNALAGDVINLKKKLVDGEKERSKLRRDVSFLVDSASLRKTK